MSMHFKNLILIFLWRKELTNAEVPKTHASHNVSLLTLTYKHNEREQGQKKCFV